MNQILFYPIKKKLSIINIYIFVDQMNKKAKLVLARQEESFLSILIDI